MLALPGSSYLYQGEELGLHEVADLPPTALQDPIWERTLNAKKGRDGCRVPLPWSHDGDSYGFGVAHAWLPQPAGFSRSAVAAQERGPTRRWSSTGRRCGFAGPCRPPRSSSWIPTDHPEVLHFVRPGGWHCISNFGADSGVALPDGVVRVSSVPHEAGVLAGESTVWFTEWPA